MNIASSLLQRIALLLCILSVAVVAASAQPIVITFGAELYDSGTSVAMLSDGGSVVTGSFQRTVDFDPGPGVVSCTSEDESAAFVARYAADGSFVSVATVGGTGVNIGTGVAVDALGNAVVTGYFLGTADFDPGPGVVSRTSAGSADAFVARYDASGALVSVATFGSMFDDRGRGVAVDALGNAVVTGTISGTADFDPGAGMVYHSTAGQEDAFVARYDARGALVSVATFGGISNDRGYAVAVDALGNAVVTGYFTDTVDFDPGAGVVSRTSTGGNDVFVARYDASGALVSVTTFGGTQSDSGTGVAVDASGNAVVSGIFFGTVDFDPGAGVANRTGAGRIDAFVARYTASGALVSLATFGGTQNDDGLSVAVDASGNAVVVGYFNGTVDFDPGLGVVTRTSTGGNDSFVARYSASGALVSVATFGTGYAFCGGVAVDASGNAVVTGSFQRTVDFDPGAGVVNRTSAGSSDVFVARYTASGGLLPVRAEAAVTAAGSALVLGPNPVRGLVRGTLSLPVGGRARVGVYDGLGREVAVLFEGVAETTTALAFDASGVAPGVYVVRAEVGGGGQVLRQPLVVVR